MKTYAVKGYSRSASILKTNDAGGDGPAVVTLAFHEEAARLTPEECRDVALAARHELERIINQTEK